MVNPLAQSLTSDMILRQQLVEQSLETAKKQQKKLELPKELCFSSDESDEDAEDDLAGFRIVVASKKTVKYMPDSESDLDGAKIGFNYKWHDSIKREKNLIIEAPRPKVNTIRAA